MPLAHLHDPIVLVVSALAVYRLTRLLTADEILAEPRARLVNGGGRAGYLATCAWCVSIWVAVAWLLLLLLAPLLAVLIVGVPLACSAAAGLLSSWE